MTCYPRLSELEIVDGECILMFAEPTGIPRAHYPLRKVFRCLPA